MSSWLVRCQAGEARHAYLAVSPAVQCWTIERTIAEGDMVFLHARFTPAPGAPEFALADVFRLKDCKIVEHWDVVGAPLENQLNTNPRF